MHLRMQEGLSINNGGQVHSVPIQPLKDGGANALEDAFNGLEKYLSIWCVLCTHLTVYRSTWGKCIRFPYNL